MQISIALSNDCNHAVTQTLHDGSLFRSADWCGAIAEGCGYAPAALVVRHDAELVAALPLCLGRDLFRRRIAVALPFTAAVNVPDAPRLGAAIMRNAPRACADAGIDRLQLRAAEPFGGESAGANLEHVTYALPLNGSAADLLARSSPDHRRRLRLVREAGTFRIETTSVAVFYDVYCRRMKELGSPAAPASLFAQIARRFGGAVAVLAALDGNGACAAAMFLLAHGSTSYFLWGAASRLHHGQHVNHLLYRAAIEWALERGFETFDFGRSDVRGGTGRFKKQFGAVARQLFYYDFDRTGALVRTLPRRGMFLGSRLWRHLPQRMTDAAGSYVCGALFP